MMDLLTVFALVAFCHVASSEVVNPGPLVYTATAWEDEEKFVSSGESVKISCDTDQVYANMFLYKRESSDTPWRKILLTDNSRLTVLGQTFVIESIMIRDSGYYRCLAEMWDGERKELIKGQLVVNPVEEQIIPEIFPDDPILRIDLDQGRNVTCKTIGASGSESFLAWYRRSNTGNLTKVDSGRISRHSELTDGKYIDIETLMFKSFTEEDVGDYVCQREEYDATSTQRVLRVETQDAFVFDTNKWRINISGAGEAAIKMELYNHFLFISCQTNNADANVVLNRRISDKLPWQVVQTSDSGHVMQIGQTFLIKQLSYSDTAYYKCQATNHAGRIIELEKGKLIASIVQSEGKPPYILPHVPILNIKANEEKNVSCQADGMAGDNNLFLKWYRVGKQNEYIYVDESKLTSQKPYTTGKYREILTLTFKSFSREDAGEYLCVRKVSHEKTTKAIIHIKMET